MQEIDPLYRRGIETKHNTQHMISLIVLSVFFLFLSIGQLVNVVDSKPVSGNRQDRVWKMKKTSCEEDQCSHFIKEEAYNCVNNCTSPSCYEEVYSANPLEDGEIDSERNRLFVSCLRKESRKLNVSRYLVTFSS